MEVWVGFSDQGVRVGGDGDGGEVEGGLPHQGHRDGELDGGHAAGPPQAGAGRQGQSDLVGGAPTENIGERAGENMILQSPLNTFQSRKMSAS